jgi:hypothetical protein
MTATASPRWLGYVEEHDIADDDRRGEGRAQRLTRPPEAVLTTPDEVAAWVSAQIAHHGGRADHDARQRNSLIGDRSSVNRSVAAKGGSVYASLHLSGSLMVDLCVEIQASDGCSSARGHSFQQNAKGEWRCVNCGQLM